MNSYIFKIFLDDVEINQVASNGVSVMDAFESAYSQRLFNLELGKVFHVMAGSLSGLVFHFDVSLAF